jgi:hypothetical protein
MCIAARLLLLEGGLAMRVGEGIVAQHEPQLLGYYSHTPENTR